MIGLRNATTGLILSYVAAFLFLTALLSTDAKPISPRTSINRLWHDKATLPAHQARRGLPSDGTLQARSDVAILGERGLIVKRGSCLSTGGNRYRCSSEPPTVAECVTKIRERGNVGTKISVFYSSLGNEGGLTKCKQYFSCPETAVGDVVLWDSIVDNKWLHAQGLALMKAYPNDFSTRDMFPKRLSQAFGEASSGHVYVCTPEDNAPDNNFRRDLAWGGWEYPALTRNRDVMMITRVDPTTKVLRQIWQRGDPETAEPPKG